jgi:hypothetical protein
LGHIFVSYSRGDIAFAERLEEALRAEGREIWRDKKDMMPAADWAQEISRAIVGADTVIFVISPSSIVSQSCAMELAQSVENRKRIIPVVCADVDPKTDPVPDAVARLDWIFLRPSDDFASGMRRLALGLDTDLDYWHRGAEIAERARQWKARASDRSLLLRGKDLEDAQGWLLLGASRVPSPSPFQADFIDTSRRANTQRQRQTVAGLSGVSVVLLLLTLVAGVFAKVANDRGQLALSHQLSGQSNTVRLEQNRPDLALLYGIQGVQLNDNANTRDSLAAALTNEPHLSALLETTEAAASPAHAVTAVAYSRDGSAAYASTIDGTILRWDMKTLQRTGYHTPSHSGPAYISRMDIGPDGKSLAYIDGGGLWLWNQITSGGKAQLLFDFTKLVTDKRTPALSFQNSLALAYTTRGSIEVVIAPGCNDSSPIAGVIAWNAATAKLSAAYSLPVLATLCPAGPYNIVDVAAIRPDGLRVAISCNNAATAAKPTCPSRQIQLWDLSDPKNAVQLVNALADTTHGPDPTKPANPAPPPNPYIPIGKLVYADGPQGCGSWARAPSSAPAPLRGSGISRSRRTPPSSRPGR